LRRRSVVNPAKSLQQGKAAVQSAALQRRPAACLFQNGTPDQANDMLERLPSQG
jgi:hypothetical protein